MRVGAPLRGTPVRPNMLNTPKSASVRRVAVWLSHHVITRPCTDRQRLSIWSYTDDTASPPTNRNMSLVPVLQNNPHTDALTPPAFQSWAAQPRGVKGQCTPTFEAKGVQGRWFRPYSSQFRLYSGVRQGSILFHLLFNIHTDELIYALHESR